MRFGMVIRPWRVNTVAMDVFVIDFNSKRCTIGQPTGQLNRCVPGGTDGRTQAAGVIDNSAA